MTIDEAIKHCEEVASGCVWEAMKCDESDGYESHVMAESLNCAADHRQLAEWLTELKERREADTQLVDRWISCKDKMPEDNTIVLFVYVSENGIKSVHYGYHHTIKGFGSSWAKPSGGWQYCDDEVKYWQPLPEPPSEATKG